MDSLDVWRTAAILRQEHGEIAHEIADSRFKAFLKSGDMEGAGLWQMIIDCLIEMDTLKPPGPVN